MNYKLLLVCLIFSGFSGLAYELLWVRLLSFSFGSSTAALSTVLAVFFGGLSLGALLAGKMLDRVKRPVLVYAFIETLTGITGLLLYPVLLKLPDFFASLATGDNGRDLLIRVILSIIIILIPTVLMGTTLPVVCKAIIYKNNKIGQGTGLIYGINTLGAFLGAYLTTYHFLPHFGIKRSILLAVTANIIAAGFAAWLHWRGYISDHGKQNNDPVNIAAQLQDHAPTKKLSAKFPIVVFLAFLSGFAFILLQVVWARLFSTLLGGTIYGIGSVLICFLVGIGVGSLFSAKISARVNPAIGFAFLQALTILALVSFIFTIFPISYLLGSMKVVAGSVSFGQHIQLGIVFLAIGIPTLCSGASFPLLVELVSNRASQVGRSLAILYASNTVGCIISSLLVGFFLLPRFGSGATLLFSAIIFALMAIIAGLLLVPAPQRKWGWGCAVVALLLMVRFPHYSANTITAPVNANAVSYHTYAQQAKLSVKQHRFFHEGIAANVLVTQSTRYEKSLALNGLGQGGLSTLPPSHILESTLMAAIPNIFTQPENALVIGLGAGVTVDLFKQLDNVKVDVVELEPAVVKAVDIIFSGKSPVKSPRVSTMIGDARHHLLVNSVKGKSYDIITSMPAHPWVASSLFTQDFFKIAKQNLTERGVFCCWFGFNGTREQLTTKVLLQTFISVFENYAIFFVKETGAFYLVGGKEKLEIDLDRFQLFSTLDAFGQHEILKTPLKLLSRIYATGDGNTASFPSDTLYNTDDNAFIEVQFPLEQLQGQGTDKKELSKHYLPRPYLDLHMVSGNNKNSFFLDLQEEIMGTPDGSLSLVPGSPVSLEPLVQLLDNLEMYTISDQLTYYLRGRLALLQNKTDQGRKYLLQASAGNNKEISFRSKKMHFLSYPQKDRQYKKYFKDSAISDDVFTEYLTKDKKQALIFIHNEMPVPSTSPILWLAQKVSQQTTVELTRKERIFFTTRVKPILEKTVYIVLAELGEEFADIYQFPLVQTVLENRKIYLKAKKANQLYREGIKLGQKGMYVEAGNKFLRSIELNPENIHAIERYFYSLMRQQKWEDVEAEIIRLSTVNKREVITALAANTKKYIHKMNADDRNRAH